ncbi:MAG: methylaspartate mutase subunit S [Syntrophus sp. GWC2_56_31]|nr:MAG: methylaspartate mutase subunit S [Syntrophus sp. GWC2_56_31]
MEDEGNPATLVMGVIGSDSHAIGNRILAYALNEAGYNVINLGSFVSQEEFINAAIESSVDVILVSSLCGHAEIDCQGFKNKLIEAGLQDTLLYIGGTLAVGETKWEDIEQRFKKIGFTRIAPPYTRPGEVIKWLHEDLDKRKNTKVA